MCSAFDCWHCLCLGISTLLLHFVGDASYRRFGSAGRVTRNYAHCSRVKGIDIRVKCCNRSWILMQVCNCIKWGDFTHFGKIEENSGQLYRNIQYLQKDICVLSGDFNNRGIVSQLCRYQHFLVAISKNRSLSNILERWINQLFIDPESVLTPRRHFFTLPVTPSVAE